LGIENIELYADI
jgi:hypothetical protein